MKTKEIKELINLLETNKLTSLSYKDKDVEISVAREGTYAPVVREESVPLAVSHKNTVVSPLVGVYYSKPGPDDAPFVAIGQSIEVGDVICIIEAMKVMSEIKSDKAGVVSEILLQDGTPIAFDQTILVLK